ncbi:exonuclease [Rhodococcus phage ReqiPine5]|uniref:Gp42 n=1 Tax=Rhodococcus phage ReqiPine5 TaxID=691963 RepID=D4P817_9CAUD|nr:exonuclease [Rhodococcus phage ReqiPine5]ADD81147.1 gp42 [Rhodococcus phage ReqiPine5]
MTAFGLDAPAESIRAVAARTTEHHGFLLPPPKPGKWEPEYNGRGQYKVPDPEGSGKTKAYTRTTTMTKTLEDTTHVVKWEKRRLIEGILSYGEKTPELFEALDQLFADEDANKTAINKRMEDLEVAGGRWLAAEFGTAVHAWAEEVDCGRLLLRDVPEEYREWVDQYLKRLAAKAITPMPEYTERVVYNSKANCCGQLDRVYLMPDGDLVLGDVKTSKSLIYSYGAYSMQLAIYRDADYMLSEDGTTWEPMPQFNRDYALLANIPSNNPEGTELYPYELGPGRAGLELALAVRKHRNDVKKTVQSVRALPIPTREVVNAHANVYCLRTARDETEVRDNLAKMLETPTPYADMYRALAQTVIDQMTR